MCFPPDQPDHRALSALLALEGSVQGELRAPSPPLSLLAPTDAVSRAEHIGTCAAGPRGLCGLRSAAAVRANRQPVFMSRTLLHTTTRHICAHRHACVYVCRR